MKLLAIKKQQAFSDQGFPMLDNYHFFCVPLEIQPNEVATWQMMGFQVIEVEDNDFERLVESQASAMKLQLELQTLLSNIPVPKSLDYPNLDENGGST